MNFEIEPIDWSYATFPEDQRPMMKQAIFVLCVIAVIYFTVLLLCEFYRWRRKNGIEYRYRVDLIFKNDQFKETIYVITYSRLDIILYFCGLAKTKIHKMRNKKDWKGKDFIILQELTDLEEKEKKENQKAIRRLREFTDRIAFTETYEE